MRKVCEDVGSLEAAGMRVLRRSGTPRTSEAANEELSGDAMYVDADDPLNTLEGDTYSTAR